LEIGHHFHIPAYIPKFEYCTDNAAMIAITAHYKLEKNEFCDIKVVPFARYN